MGSLKDQIFSSDDIKRETVIVPEWNDAVVVVQGMTGKERDEFELGCELAKAKGLGDSIDPRGLRVQCLIQCLYNDDGERIFSPEDEDKLSDKSSAVLDRLFNIAQRLSKLSSKDIEDMSKN